LLKQKYTSIYCRRVAQGKVEYTSDPSVAEAGVIVATVGALLLSIIVPVAETVPLAMLKVSSTSSIVSAVVGTTVPVVAPAGTVTIVSSRVIPLQPFHLLEQKYTSIYCRRVAQCKFEYHQILQ
jgi:hypothetical protein